MLSHSDTQIMHTSYFYFMTLFLDCKYLIVQISHYARPQQRTYGKKGQNTRCGKDGRALVSSGHHQWRAKDLWETDKEVAEQSVMTISVSAKSTRTRLLARAGHSRPSPMTGGRKANRARLPNTVCGYRTAKNRARRGDQYVTDITGHQIVGSSLQRFAVANAEGHQQHKVRDAADPQLRLSLRRY